MSGPTLTPSMDGILRDAADGRPIVGGHEATMSAMRRRGFIGPDNKPTPAGLAAIGKEAKP